MAKHLRTYTHTAAARELDLSPGYMTRLVERGKLTAETVEVRGTRERFVTAASVERLKQERSSCAENR